MPVPSRPASEAVAASQGRIYLLAKRLFDVILASWGLVMSAPLWLVIAALILLEDGWPVFFTDERTGRDNNRFRLLKFRSMRQGTNLVLDVPPRNDPRLTRVGRRLRSTALDELPNLLNILKGDMSFVGPKPLAPFVHTSTDPDHGKAIEDVRGYWRRCTVAPGLTGLAQVYAPKDAPYRVKFRYDALYARKASFRLDIGMIGASIARTLAGGWERMRLAP